jgi:HD-GYP domain-containing protein (c-di-GMP phosphodiesterase class II)
MAGLQPSDAPKNADFIDHKLDLAITKTRSGDQNHLALEIKHLIPEQEVTFEVFVKEKRPEKGGSAYSLRCSSGEKISSNWTTQLLESGISRVYFRTGDLSKVLTYLEPHLAKTVIDESLPPAQRADCLANIIYFWLGYFFTEWRVEGVSRLADGLKYLDNMLEVIRQDRYYRSWLLYVYRHDQNLFSHSLNCSLLAIGFGTYLGWPENNIRDLAQAALLHDIALTMVPLSILSKPGSLTTEEKEAIKKHTRRGFYLLQTFFPVSRDTLLAVLQHHENGDGSGYPEGLKLPMIHPMARVLRIIDSYNALTSPRSWREPFEPEKALWILRQEWQESGIFDASLLMEFIKFLSE